MAMGYATVVGTTWSRYGHLTSASPDECDPLLDQFMPEYEVAERHHVRVAAPAAITLAAAADTDLQQSRIIRAIFKARELVLGAEPDCRGATEGAARADDVSRVARARREAGTRDRRRRRDPTVAAERRLSRPCAGGVSSIPRTGLREDRLDAAGGSRQRH